MPGVATFSPLVNLMGPATVWNSVESSMALILAWSRPASPTHFSRICSDAYVKALAHRSGSFWCFFTWASKYSLAPANFTLGFQPAMPMTPSAPLKRSR